MGGDLERRDSALNEITKNVGVNTQRDTKFYVETQFGKTTGGRRESLFSEGYSKLNRVKTLI